MKGGDVELEERDPEVWNIINDEYDRQRKGIELIASENFISTAVMQVRSERSTQKQLISYSVYNSDA